MPRLAPVSSSVRRGWFDCELVIWSFSSWIESRLAPRPTQIVALEFDAVVQAERPLLPELNREWHDAVARPVERPRNVGERVFGGVDRNRLLEGEAAFQRRRLLARPGADLRLLRSAGEIGIGLGVGDPLDVAAHADLPAWRLPVKNPCRFRPRGQISSLLAVH